MFAIESISKQQKNRKFVGLRKDKLPYPVYEGNPNFPKEIFGFTSVDEAVSYIDKIIIHRENINPDDLTTTQMIDIVLVNNAIKFQIVEFELVNDKMDIIKEYPQPQFNRKD